MYIWLFSLTIGLLQYTNILRIKHKSVIIIEPEKVAKRT